MTSPLTERERWIAKYGYRSGIIALRKNSLLSPWIEQENWIERWAEHIDTCAPPPEPCPHIVSSDEGTSYCGLNGPGLVWSDEPKVLGWYLRRGAPQDTSRWLSDFTDRLPSPSDRFGQYAGPLDMPQEPSE